MRHFNNIDGLSIEELTNIIEEKMKDIDGIEEELLNSLFDYIYTLGYNEGHGEGYYEGYYEGYNLGYDVC